MNPDLRCNNLNDSSVIMLDQANDFESRFVQLSEPRPLSPSLRSCLLAFYLDHLCHISVVGNDTLFLTIDSHEQAAIPLRMY